MTKNDIKILIVDDDKSVCESLKRILEGQEFSVFTAENGKEGKEILSKKEINVILLDIRLPDVDGIELLSEFKDLYPNIEIILITAYASIKNAISAINKAAFGFIEKPFEFPQLVALIKQAFEKQSLKIELRYSEIKFRNLFDKSPFPIIIFNTDEIAIECNSTLQKLLKYDKNEIINKNFYDVFSLFNIPQIVSLSQLILNETSEIVAKNKNGDLIWLSLNVHLIKINQQDLYQLVIMQDITDQIEMDKEFERKNLYIDQILKASQFKTKFLSTMSHELRTPLNAIIGFCEVLSKEFYGPLNDEQKEYLNDILSSAEHLFEMINRILDISKIEAGKLELNFKEISLNKLLEQINTTIYPMLQERGLIYKVKGLNSDANIYVDPFRLKEILINLLGNAIKFTLKGQINIKIIETPDYWEFKIEDTGIGIDQKDHDIIFQDFKRVDSHYVRATPGSGLGLSLIKRLVELHGGNISFTSTLGKGTTFIFTISKKLDQNMHH